MADKVIYEEKINVGEDRKVVIQLPPDTPLGEFIISMKQTTPESTSESEWTAEDEAAFQAEVDAYFNDPNLFYGKGLRSDELAKLPGVGSWAHRTDIVDSVDFVNQMRREMTERRLKRD